ncbi:peptidylprolyl isomerase [Alkalibaculum sp. M08DMB]|uniref:peptidylprolyl isomerase n=1 Tax=Alkalibaculum sporogenes TaxID=2655001 RepID=A0A6A7K969_9FIRM|nr:peptidylprolyl isomerase [Alkalibaculum sporogenes]MPW25990.1 peptidylprolyl isomerase [Alkalibaculum sporogenes]
MNPTATLVLNNGKSIVIELLPEAAPNTVNSFIFAALNGVYNQHAIERIVSGNWIDMSYSAFHNEKAKYLIPYESQLHPEIEPLPSIAGCVCMGGYDELGLSGCEFFFTLRDCPEHRGVYPVFGRVIEGIDELYRLEKVKTKPITDFPYKNVEINEPIQPEIIRKVEVDLKGFKYDRPIKLPSQVLPKCWAMEYR